MELTIHGKQLALEPNQHIETMDVRDFVESFDYDIDKLYIDRFWDSISDEQWVVVDYDMLKWMGYSNERDTDKKKYYLKMLKNNFIEHEDYDIVSEEDLRVRVLKHPNENILIVSPDTFKSSLMMLRTDKSKTIRQYYLTLEKIFKDYVRYTQTIKDHNHAIELAQLRIQPPVIDIDRTPMRADKFVYVMVSERSFRQCLFKIGRANDPCRRLTQHNTAAATNLDTMFYTHVIPCVDPIGLEKTLHQLLKRYHDHNEWYRIPHQQLKRIVDLTIRQQQDILAEINACLAEEVDPPNTMTIQQFEAKPLPRIAPVAVVVSSDGMCDLCRTPLIGNTCPACRDVPETTLALFRGGAAPSFNSSKHASVLTMLDDENYCAWLLSQPWFRRHPEHALIAKLYIPKQSSNRKTYT